jgi:hypothetical protein
MARDAKREVTVDTHSFESTLKLEREPAIATPHWEAKWFAAGSAFDPSYDRATAALRRWVDGMEAALKQRRR